MSRAAGRRRGGGPVGLLRADVLAAGFVLAVPVLLLGLRGDLPADDVVRRLLWCLAAGWAVVALLHLVLAPRPRPAGRPVPAAPPAAEGGDPPG